MSIMAFIPARGGSKGIPRKNMALLGGKPLIQYTIEAANASKYVNEIFISSDDNDIISFCQSIGIDVPYKRPPELARDESPMIMAVLDALRWKKENNLSLPESILLLQPTSPLRNHHFIDEAVNQFINKDSESLISVHEMIEHPYECVRALGSKWEFLARPEKSVFRRQDYQDTFYYINGAIYLAKRTFLEKNRSYFLEGETDLFVMPAEYGLDIDDEHDLMGAEHALKWMKA